MLSHPASIDLCLAGTYSREVPVSLAAVWENVFDWSHLPALHADTFAACRLLEKTRTGWVIESLNQGDPPERSQRLRLTVQRDRTRYKVVTEQGPGAGSEIRVQLTRLAARRTGVFVRFMVPETIPARLEAIGRRYRNVYEKLWDEDEAMMLRREAMRAESRLPESSPPEPMCLGPEAEVRSALPMTVRFGVGQFRLHSDGSSIVAFSAICPHWLGPLDETPVEDWIVRCPWHDYRFDTRSGKCISHKGGPQLATPPSVQVRDGNVWLEANNP